MIIPALTSWKVAALGKIVGTHFEIHASVDALGMAALAGPHAVFHGAGASPFRGVDSSRALYSHFGRGRAGTRKVFSADLEAQRSQLRRGLGAGRRACGSQRCG